MPLRLLLAAVLLAMLCSCGYHLSGRGNGLPEDVRTVYIEAFANRTREPFVENLLTNVIVSEFARGGMLDVTENRQAADAVLGGKVTSYASAAASFDERDRIVEYRSQMSVEAALRRRDSGRVLWKGSVSWSEEYLADADLAVREDNEARTIETLAERIAEELYARILDAF